MRPTTSRVLAALVAFVLLARLTGCTSGSDDAPPEEAPDSGFCGCEDAASDAAFEESGFQDGFEFTGDGSDSATNRCASLAGSFDCLASCSGLSAAVVPASECPSAHCEGGTAYALCSQSIYAECACRLPSGYSVIGADAGHDGGSTEAGEHDAASDGPVPDAPSDGAFESSGSDASDASPACPKSAPIAGSACSEDAGPIGGCTYGTAMTCVCLPSGKWACT